MIRRNNFGQNVTVPTLIETCQASITIRSANHVVQFFDSPVFDYADIIWGDKDNTIIMVDLQILQNKAAKVILDLPSNASSTDAPKTLGWPTLLQQRLAHRYIATSKYIHGLVDYCFNI